MYFCRRSTRRRLNQELQQKEELSRIYRLNKLANLPFSIAQNRLSTMLSPAASSGPSSPIAMKEQDYAVTPDDAAESMLTATLKTEGVGAHVLRKQRSHKQDTLVPWSLFSH